MRETPEIMLKMNAITIQILKSHLAEVKAQNIQYKGIIKRVLEDSIAELKVEKLTIENRDWSDSNESLWDRLDRTIIALGKAAEEWGKDLPPKLPDPKPSYPTINENSYRKFIEQTIAQGMGISANYLGIRYPTPMEEPKYPWATLGPARPYGIPVNKDDWDKYYSKENKKVTPYKSPWDSCSSKCDDAIRLGL